MSVVANVLCTRATWIAYDGRALRNGEIISESTEKAVMVNDFVCVGYTGTLELAQLVILNLRHHIVGISDMKSNTVAKAIEILLPKLGAPKDVNATFLVTGVNSNGKMASYSLGSSQKLYEYIPYGGDIKTAVLHSGANTLQLEPYVVKYVRKFGLSSLAITNALQDYIKSVSKIDTSVNAQCQVIELRK